MRPYHPTDGGADPGNEPTREQIIAVGNDIHRRVEELLADWPQGRRCPVCDGSMIHYRLYGYRCPRGCRP